jgi:Leucine-rich repeat (LRR) protein
MELNDEQRLLVARGLNKYTADQDVIERIHGALMRRTLNDYRINDINATTVDLNSSIELDKLRVVVPALSIMPTLTELHLDYNHITDVGPLEPLTMLTKLFLHSNDIADVGPLASLTNLTLLDLGGNPRIADVSPLKSLKMLTQLDLGWNPLIADVSPLAYLTNLTRLDLSHIPIEETSLVDLTNAIPALDLVYQKPYTSYQKRIYGLS